MPRGYKKSDADDTKESVGVEVAEEKAEPKPKGKRFRVKVYHLDMAEDNKNMPIFVACNGERKELTPGKEEVVSEGQLNVLRTAATEFEITLPNDSAIYTEPQPLRAVEKLFPDCTAQMDPRNGLIKVIQHKRRFSVEVVEEVK